MIVIALTNVPPSLRGDLTKWCQEIQAGFFIGHVSARIRDHLWERITSNIGSGRAVMAFNAANELGYQYRTTRVDQAVVDFDGIPLLMQLTEKPLKRKEGFSNAARQQAAQNAQKKQYHQTANKVENRRHAFSFVVLDIETTGVSVASDSILSISALRHYPDGTTSLFNKLIATDAIIKPSISKLTGITSQVTKEKGIPIKDALTELTSFVKDDPIVGYNIRFDDAFISQALLNSKLPPWGNPMIDLLPKIKRINKTLTDYKLSTVLDYYGIANEQPHQSRSDVSATANLTLKLMENGVKVF